MKIVSLLLFFVGLSLSLGAFGMHHYLIYKNKLSWYVYLSCLDGASGPKHSKGIDAETFTQCHNLGVDVEHE